MVTFSNHFHVENFLQSITARTLHLAAGTWGPYNHLPFIYSTKIPFVKSSETLIMVGQWNQSAGFDLLCISPTREETYGLKLLLSLLIQEFVTRLSEKYRILSNLNHDSSTMLLPRRLAMTAACNSRRGIVSCLRGVTLDFAAANRTPNLPSLSFHWT